MTVSMYLRAFGVVAVALLFLGWNRYRLTDRARARLCAVGLGAVVVLDSVLLVWVASSEVVSLSLPSLVMAVIFDAIAVAAARLLWVSTPPPGTEEIGPYKPWLGVPASPGRAVRPRKARRDGD